MRHDDIAPFLLDRECVLLEHWLGQAVDAGCQREGLEELLEVCSRHADSEAPEGALDVLCWLRDEFNAEHVDGDENHEWRSEEERSNFMARSLANVLVSDLMISRMVLPIAH